MSSHYSSGLLRELLQLDGLNHADRELQEFHPRESWRCGVHSMNTSSSPGFNIPLSTTWPNGTLGSARLDVETFKLSNIIFFDCVDTFICNFSIFFLTLNANKSLALVFWLQHRSFQIQKMDQELRRPHLLSQQ